MIERRSKKTLHPYLNLNMGIVKHYIMRVAVKDEPRWTAEGWIRIPENPVFTSRAREGFVDLMNKPETLSETGIERLLGVRVLDYGVYLGTYGNGGAGFFGLLLEPSPGKDYSEYLAYACWSSGSFALLDNRVIESSPKYQDEDNPWHRRYPKSSELAGVLENSVITAIDLQDQTCTLDLLKDNTHHILELVTDDPRVSSGNSGKRRESKVTTRISDYLLFQHEHAQLWV